jgi:alpha-1,3/alpha-1,6-mannosyltransferase
MASLRQLHLTASLLTELGSRGNSTAKDKTAPGQEDQDDIFIVDQLPACVPILKSLGRPRKSRRQRILFYCHFPDQLLARRNEGGSLLQLAKLLYRFPFDWFEGWAMSASDRVVANSNFSRGVVHGVFGTEKLGDVEVVYPCVDTISAAETLKKELEDALWGGKKILLSINRFERKKDMGLAIRAYNGLGAGKRKGTRLVVAGKASYFLPRAIIMQYMETNSTSTSRWLRQSRPRKCPIPPRTRQSCQRPRLADGNDKDGSIRTLHP